MSDDKKAVAVPTNADPEPYTNEERRQMIAEAITEHWGERCTEYASGCPCCEVWAGFDAMEAEVARCHARLETDHHFVIAPGTDELVRVEVPFEERADALDGIEARDATIMLLESEIERLRAALGLGEPA